MPTGVVVFSRMIIPLQFVGFAIGGQIMVDVELNGKSARMIVDTGASRTVFDPVVLTDFIESPQFEEGQGHVVGVDGAWSGQKTVVIDSLAIGDAVLTAFEAVAVDLSNIRNFNSVAGMPDFVGIIGGDVLQRLKATINYGRRTLTVRKTPKM